MDGLLARAGAVGAARIWLVTTNDNTRALRFYQQWGMDLVDLVRHGVDASRRLKPTIPATGRDGIPLRHELVLERRLGRDDDVRGLRRAALVHQSRLLD